MERIEEVIKAYGILKENELSVIAYYHLQGDIDEFLAEVK